MNKKLKLFKLVAKGTNITKEQNKNNDWGDFEYLKFVIL
jgi:hypothetical protein